MNIVYAHDESAGRHVAAMFASTPEGASNPIKRLYFNESLMNFSELGSGRAVPGVCDVNLRNTLYTASTPTFFDTGAMKDLYESFGSFIGAHPIANRSILLFEAASGQTLATLPDDYSAYPHRGKMTTNAIIQVTWDEGGDEDLSGIASAWGKGARDLLAKPKVSGYDRLYAYVNYANDDEPLSALYGYEDWRHRRLVGLKQKYDPHGFFNAYRPIPSELNGWQQSVLSQMHTGHKDEL